MNSIALAQKYQPLLDEVYKNEALSIDLESKEVIFDGVDTVKILKVQVPKLGDYSRNSGFTQGDVTVEWEPWKLEQDRGREFNVDAVDNEETLDMTFGAASREFIRLSVAPEIDLFRFSKLAGTTGISTVAGAALSTGEAVLNALTAAMSTMDEDEVPSEGRILYITPTLKRLVDAVDKYKSKDVWDSFAKVVKVPQARFVTAITKDATTKEYSKDATDGKNINFLIVHPSAVQATAQHVALRVFLANGDEGTGANKNQKADAHCFQYRIVHDEHVYANKVAGIYLHKSTT